MSGTRVLHYEILRPLGRGGMGEVVEAVDSRLGRHVALKFVAAELASDVAHGERFEREARAAAGLTHPNIAVVHAFESDAGRMFLVMELLSGRTLRALLADGPLPVPQAVRIAREMASALAFAHSKHIHHRDVKPENVMFDAHGAAKLMDFGLAHAANATRLTRTNTALGTPAYMAPEAIAGQSEPASDVFALGVMLHEMLAGSLPFPGDNAMALMYAISNVPPRPVLAARPEVGAALAELIARMLQKAPADRVTAAQAVRELDIRLGTPTPAPISAEGVTQELPVLSPDEQPRAVQDARTQELSVERVAPPLPVLATSDVPRRRRPVALVVAVLVLALGAYPAWRWRVASTQAAHVRAHTESDAGTQALLARDLPQARARFEAALRIEPDLGGARIGLAAVESEQGDRSAAAARLAGVLRDLPAGEHVLRAAAWSHLAEIAIADGNWPDAALNLRRAFAEDSSDAAAYNQLGHALLRAGAAGEARAVLARGIARFPSVAPLHKNAGLAALALDDVAAAEASARQALAADPAYAPAWALTARIAARRNDQAAALTAFGRYQSSGATDSLELADTRRDLLAHGAAIPDR